MQRAKYDRLCEIPPEGRVWRHFHAGKNMLYLGSLLYFLVQSSSMIFSKTMAALKLQVCEGDNLEREHSFYVRGSDSEQGASRCVELFSSTMAEKREWMNSLWNVISDALFRKQSFQTNTSNSCSPGGTPSVRMAVQVFALFVLFGKSVQF